MFVDILADVPRAEEGRSSILKALSREEGFSLLIIITVIVYTSYHNYSYSHYHN